MYAAYTHKAGATAANVLADVIKLITGETNKANLSADCIQGATTITSTEAAGWAVYDAAAGASIQCVRALNQDATTYKYALVQFASTIACSIAVAEAWDASAHTGTNLSTYDSSVWAASVQNTIIVYATPKNIFIIPTTGGNLTQRQIIFVAELSRDSIPSTYPCAVVSIGVNLGNAVGNVCTIPRLKLANALGDATNQSIGLIGMVPNSTYSTVTQLYRDASENVQVAFSKIGAAGGTAAQGFHCYGTVYDIWMSGGALTAAAFDTQAYNSKTYVVFFNATKCTLFIPKE